VLCYPQVPALRSWKPYVVESNFEAWCPPNDWAAAAETELVVPSDVAENANSGFTPYPPYSNSDPLSPGAIPQKDKQGESDSASGLKDAAAEPTATLSVPLDEWSQTVRHAAAITGAAGAGADDTSALREQLHRLQPSQLIQKCRALGASEAACDACADAKIPREAYADLCVQLLNV
jgi:hypothetical protein